MWTSICAPINNSYVEIDYRSMEKRIIKKEADPKVRDLFPFPSGRGQGVGCNRNFRNTGWGRIGLLSSAM